MSYRNQPLRCLSISVDTLDSYRRNRQISIDVDLPLPTGLAGILPACSAAPWDRRTPCAAALQLHLSSRQSVAAPRHAVADATRIACHPLPGVETPGYNHAVASRRPQKPGSAASRRASSINCRTSANGAIAGRMPASPVGSRKTPPAFRRSRFILNLEF